MFNFFSADMDFCKLHRFLHAGTVQALCAGTMQALCRHYAGIIGSTMTAFKGISRPTPCPQILHCLSSRGSHQYTQTSFTLSLDLLCGRSHMSEVSTGEFFL